MVFKPTPSFSSDKWTFPFKGPFSGSLDTYGGGDLEGNFFATSNGAGRFSFSAYINNIECAGGFSNFRSTNERFSASGKWLSRRVG